MSPWSIGMSRFPGRSWQTNARLWRPSLVLGTRARTTAADPLQPFTFSNNGPSTNEPIPRCANVAASLNHLIRPLQKRLRDGQTERLRGLEVDHELEPCPAPQLGDGREALVGEIVANTARPAKRLRSSSPPPKVIGSDERIGLRVS